jgi:XTP/dITP diphosphohydrolase
MHNIIFATNNRHKLIEVQNILGNSFNLKSLEDIGFLDEIPEDFSTLEQNASQKAWHIYNRYKTDCFADDTGLEVESLNGQPGVFSARYAGDHKNPEDNIIKLLGELHDKPNRKAQFRTIISFILDGKEHRFEGIVMGKIVEHLRGNQGFGYDPVFVPDGYTQTFAEMDLSLKNRISHRGLAIKKLTDFLLSLQ